ncbi:MAG: hypothetical protein WHS82_01285 [Candidatus Methanosuratincola sp.]
MKNRLLTSIYYNSPEFLQNLGVNLYEFTGTWLNTKSHLYRVLSHQLKISEKWSKKEFKIYQTKYIKCMINYAYRNVPFYYRIYKQNNIDISNINNIDDIKKLPIINKEQIRDNVEVFSKNKENYVKTHTSGTTGKPLHLRVSKYAYLLQLAAAYHGRRYPWANYNGGMTARFVGDAPTMNEKKLYRVSYITKRLIFPSYFISFKTLGKIVNDLKKHKVRYIQAYPSAAYLIAKYLQMKDISLPMDALFYSSEPLLDYQRELIKERFATKVFGFYGQAENAVSAVECEYQTYHLTMLDGYLEIIDDYGEHAAPGEKGFTVVTSFHNHAMPLIRYDLGDYTGLQNEDCSCGRCIPSLLPVETRIDDFIITPDGRIISPTLLTFPLKKVGGIVESQYIQKSIDFIELNIVKTDHFGDSEEKILLSEIKKLLGEDVELKIFYVNRINMTNNYKKRFVINKMDKDYLEKAFSLVRLE